MVEGLSKHSAINLKQERKRQRHMDNVIGSQLQAFRILLKTKDPKILFQRFGKPQLIK